MYPLEEVLTWEAEMSDRLAEQRQMLSVYRWMRMDLTDRRTILLGGEHIDTLTLNQVDEALFQIEEMIEAACITINEQEEEVHRMYSEWNVVHSCGV
ncbi:hypothetical protein DFP93_10637 [Aneurinibacillus soli]|uniref:Uncharacterized protein n=1 Tax=Aneurinibacillus soli TaxID=1500254 RepID=A0A0U5BG53_9BACL|nr:hypothetical protein [Aneurinibacillus soli]PYE61845.1 hypothetical protein DFP93_10637 [Aneurinibacillus soli]BAU29661.1 hypothetical protein CB4_03898 [Aneurinibacillus soli]